MSRIGRMPIAIPAGVEVKIDGSVVTVKGAKATLTREFSSEHEHRGRGQRKSSSLVRTTTSTTAHCTASPAAWIHNMVVGVTEGFKKELSVQGVGYRVA